MNAKRARHANIAEAEQISDRAQPTRPEHGAYDNVDSLHQSENGAAQQSDVPHASQHVLELNETTGKRSKKKAKDKNKNTAKLSEGG